MRKIRTLAAGGAALLASVGVPIGLGVATAAPASACSITYSSYIHLNPKPAYGTLYVTENCGTSYHIKILCKSTPTTGVYEYGNSLSVSGKSKAYCPGSDNLSAAFAVIGGVSHQLYP